MARSERVETAGRQPRLAHGAGAGPGASARRSNMKGWQSAILQLQQQAGNRTATMVIARAPAPVATPAPTSFKTPADIDALTLGAFNDYANAQADWASDAGLPAAQKQSLIALLEFARAGDPTLIGPCGKMTVHDLLATGLTADVRTKLRNYGRGKLAKDTAGLGETANVADALRDGDALGKLEAAIPKPILHHTMGEKDTGKAEFAELIKAGKVDEFAAYYRKVRPALEAPDGIDTKSFRLMIQIDGKDPISYSGVLPHVRNYHRFTAPMLDTLVTNEADTTRAKPLLLILHSGSDHNGAFSRVFETELVKTVQHPRNLTIMIEGATSLDAVGAEAAAVAKRQGKGKRIEQVMIAGHGDPHSVGLAGSQRKDGTFAADDLDLQNNRKRTEKFLKLIVANMVKGPGARIVLNACLTAADEVTGTLPKDPKAAKKAILKSLANKPSLVGRIGQLAPGAYVEGNVSSVGAGSYMEVDAAGNPTGVLHTTVPSDPLATSTNRADYVEKGAEAEGCIRAAVALWAVDRAECLKRVNARRGVAIGGFSDRVVHMAYDLLAAAPDDISFINRIANEASRSLSSFDNASEQNPDNVGGLYYAFNKAELTKVLGPLIGHLAPGGQLALDAVWMAKDPARQATFLATLDTFANVAAARQHLSDWVSVSTAALLPVASATAPTTAQAKLALWGVTDGRSDANARKFLRAGATAAGALTMPIGSTVLALTGGVAEDDVLVSIGLKGGDGPAPSNPTANVDLDGDGVNDTFVESVTRHGTVVVKRATIRARPDLAAAKFESVKAGDELYVFGRSGNWRAVERPSGGIGFVHEGWVKRKAVA